jgi:hypothetical protein
MKPLLILIFSLILGLAACSPQTMPITATSTNITPTSWSQPTPSAAAKVTPAQIAAPTQSAVDNMPRLSPIKPTPAGLTAREGYPLALQAALEWNQNAALAWVTGQLSASSQAGAGTGRLSPWTFVFENLSPQTQADTTQGFQVTVGRDGVEKSRTIPVSTAFPKPNLEDWKVDSDEALQIAESAGGARFRESDPSSIEMTVRLNQPGAFSGYPTTETVLWEIRYENSLGDRELYVDGTARDVAGMSTGWVEYPPDYTPVSAMHAYRIAQAQARTWDAQAVLFRAENNGCSASPSSPRPGGESLDWTYWFAYADPANLEESKHSFYVNVCGGELAGFEEGYPGEVHRITGSTGDWLVDSPQAMEIAGQAIEEQARARNLKDIAAFLYLGDGFQYPAASQNVTWEIRYLDWDTFPVKSISAYIDATTGALISIQDLSATPTSIGSGWQPMLIKTWQVLNGDCPFRSYGEIRTELAKVVWKPARSATQEPI